MRHRVVMRSSQPAGRRRRTATVEPLRKVTIQLHASVAEAIKAAVQAGEAPSANVFVEEAVLASLRERRRARVYAAYAEAAQDPEFMAEMDATTEAFDRAVADGLPSE